VREAGRPAEEYGDYRAFRWFALNGARLVVACLFLVGWNLAFVRHRETLVFLGSTALLALGVSLVAATVSYSLYRRRGGQVVKTRPPREGQNA
jgi:hypothetical protein